MFWRILENLRESWKILENLRESWKISENLGKSRRILENLGGGKGGVNSFLWGRLQHIPSYRWLSYITYSKSD